MRQDFESLFLNRILVVGILAILIFFVLFIRLYYLQVMESPRYSTLARDNCIDIRLLPAPRARVMDAQGLVLAENQRIFNVIIERDRVKDMEYLLVESAKILQLSPETLTRIRRELKQKPRYIPLLLKSNLTWEEVATLEVNAFSLEGLRVQSIHKRAYPLGEAASHITGYVGEPNDKDIETDPSLAFPGSEVGKEGLEKVYDSLLKGVPGKEEVEVNARGRVVRTLGITPPQKPSDVLVTIDVALQSYLYDQFKPHKSGGAVVMDVETGAILALVSYPGFDPNHFAVGIKEEEWQSLIHNPLKPLTNKVIGGLYSPASLFKIVVGLAATATKHITKEQSFYCPGHMMLGSHRFHCWKKEGHGTLDFLNAIERSCDVYFYELALKIGYQPIIEMARSLGFGIETGIDLPMEKKGLVPDPTWKRKIRKEPWYKGDTVLLSIGQGNILATPLQLATMMAHIVNGGETITPHLIEKSHHPKEHHLHLGINGDAMRIVQEGLGRAINASTGTAYQSRLSHENWKMGGKTATAQVRRISLAERQNGIRQGAALPWELRDHSLFVGFAPLDAPKYVIAIIVEHGGWGSSAAAPIAQKTMNKLYTLLKERGEV